MGKLKRFDAAKYFTTPESQAELLADAEASGHAGYLANAKQVIARAQRRTAPQPKNPPDKG
jgi:DNA-binding phage protein